MRAVKIKLLSTRNWGIVEEWLQYYIERPVRSLQLVKLRAMSFENVDYTSLDIPSAPFRTQRSSLLSLKAPFLVMWA